MGSRTLPYECEHGRVLSWGDFGPDPEDGNVGAEGCEVCAPSAGAGSDAIPDAPSHTIEPDNAGQR